MRLAAPVWETLKSLASVIITETGRGADDAQNAKHEMSSGHNAASSSSSRLISLSLLRGYMFKCSTKCVLTTQYGAINHSVDC